jgi:hypothetical protein
MDKLIPFIVVGLVVLHGAALAWSVRRGIAAVLWLNLLFSGAAVVYWAPHLAEVFEYVVGVQVFAAFEFVVLATSLLAAFRVRVPRFIIWAEFAVHFLLTIAAFVFLLTFKITRLI